MALECSRKWADFEGRLLMIGFGCIGSGVLPLLLRHINLRPEQITILGPCNRNQPVADAYGVRFESETITRENYAQVLEAHLSPGDFLLNLSVDVGSIDLAIWCQEHQVLYLDACIGPWVGGHFDVRLTPSQRSNYALRDQARALRETTDNQTTAILAHGVNPGLVSHFVKQALINLQRDLEPSSAEQAPPVNRQQWAALAERLGIKAIHIAERDTQTGSRRKRPGEFVNTWSIDGFVGEGCQPAELGWGTHERHWPDIARRHDFGNQAAIWLDQPGAATRVRSWTPLNGAYQGFLITHEESLSIAEYLTLEEDGRVRYRPTVHYAYHPCDDAILSLHELAGHNWKLQSSTRLLEASDIDHGMDELGVLLMGHARNVYWYGSRLTIDQARALCPYNTATSLQTAAGVLGGVIWAMLHPEAGVVDPDELDFEQVLEVAAPYLGEMVGVYGDWTPLAGRGVLFTEDLDTDDPWQFHNVLVH